MVKARLQSARTDGPLAGVAGSQISAEVLTPFNWFSTPPPPVATTRPSASVVADTHMRLDDIGGCSVTTGWGR